MFGEIILIEALLLLVLGAVTFVFTALGLPPSRALMRRWVDTILERRYRDGKEEKQTDDEEGR